MTSAPTAPDHPPAQGSPCTREPSHWWGPTEISPHRDGGRTERTTCERPGCATTRTEVLNPLGVRLSLRYSPPPEGPDPATDADQIAALAVALSRFYDDRDDPTVLAGRARRLWDALRATGWQLTPHGTSATQ